MKKHIIKSLVLLASVSLAACNFSGNSENTSNSSSEQPVVTSSSTSEVTTSATSTSSDNSYGSIDNSSSSTSSSSSSSTTSSPSSSSSSSSSSNPISVVLTLDDIVAKFLDGLNVKIPSLNKYGLDYSVYYYYAYDEYRISASSLEGGDTIESEYVTLCNNESTLVSMNDEYFYTIEEVGYMYGNDEYGSTFSMSFFSYQGAFYIDISRVDGAGTLDVSGIDTSWYVDYVNFDDYFVVDHFPSDEINGFFETNVTIPTVGEGKYPAMIAPSTVDEDGEITLDSFYFIMEGDKINAFANALTSANFEVNLQEEIGLDDNWDEYTYYIGSAYDTDHILYFSFMLDSNSNTLVAVHRFADAVTDQLTKNTDWTDEEKALMLSTIYEVLPFMQFGDGYALEDASDEDYDYLFLGDYYYKDLTPAYIEILKANGFKEDLDTYYTPAYILDNGVVYIEVLPYYNFGNCLEIYFEQTHKPVVTDFALSINELDIVKGATYQLTPIFTPDGATNRITWTSDNEDAATVVDGLVTISETASADTKVTITATCLNGMSDSCTFTVKEDAISGIMFTENSYKIAPGETIETSYALLPYGVESAFITLAYDVNPADAGISVANNGKVTASETAVAGTSVTLTVTCNGAYTATATVTVKSAAVTHTLNKDFFGLPGDSNYKTYSKTTSDGAYYEAQCASTHGIQIRSKNENSGIIGQFAGKACKSITITFDSNTDSARVVEIYASTSAFKISDMYGSSVDKVGTISKSGNSFTYTFTDSYSYIGLRSSGGAIYITSIDIIWG